ncbi:MAG TPA: ABC transporter permease [Aggregatilineales bacterium]|nr:ABC transporter permease [Anaerolineae bacterium]HUN09359.1 ABC transporter permease [Aggregatilineales bacterium]
MQKYLLRRLLISIPVFFAITAIIFALIEIAPGDITDYFIRPELNMTDEAEEAIRARFGLDQPPVVRYFNWMLNVFQGDLGYRFTNGQPVAATINQRLSATVLLAGTALAIGAVIGVSLGIFTALRQYSLWDFSLTSLSFLGISIPSFVAGIIFLYVFSIQLGWFPSGGMRPVDQEPTLLTTIRHLVLPACVLSLAPIANFMRYTRFAMLEVIRADYVRTARGKGMTERRITWGHSFPNALLPVITLLGLSLPTLVVGAVFTETIFSWPGMGTLYLEAVNGRDVPLLMGMNLVIALVVLTANLLTDLAYALADPRIRYD